MAWGEAYCFRCANATQAAAYQKIKGQVQNVRPPHLYERQFIATNRVAFSRRPTTLYWSPLFYFYVPSFLYQTVNAITKSNHHPIANDFIYSVQPWQFYVCLIKHHSNVCFSNFSLALKSSTALYMFTNPLIYGSCVHLLLPGSLRDMTHTHVNMCFDFALFYRACTNE